MPTPLEKLREDYLYWREQVDSAKEMLRIAGGVLPRMEESLRELDPAFLERQQQTAVQVVPKVEVLVSPPSTFQAPEDTEITPSPVAAQVAIGSSESDGDWRLRGRCRTQVQALFERFPKEEMGVDQIIAILQKHGDNFRRGAIGTAIREMLDERKIRQTRKDGNSRYYQLVETARADGEGVAV